MRRRLRRRRNLGWHPVWIGAVVIVLQLLGAAAVQGIGTEEKEAGEPLKTHPEIVKNIYEESRDEFRGFPEIQQVVSSTFPEDIRDQYPLEALQDFERLKGMYLYDPEYIVPYPELLDVDAFMEWDLNLDSAVNGPQILIFHTHGSEYYADTGPGGVIQVGEYLAQLLEEEYGLQVMHDISIYDQDAQVSAYDLMRENVGRILDENPSIQVTIDLHRDGVGGDGRLVSNIDGQDVAQLMCVTGISSEYNWETGMMEETSYLYNPYRTANLAFSFRTKMAADVMYPGLMRNMYLSTYRYSTYMREKGMLLEVGAQGNTLEECYRAMEYFAPVLMQILNGKG
ncbi:MAG: stage II sporulation protein P [Firmicutes bacterium]|nr:stage II sporulation protein P [Bacillota bacterium]